MNHWKRLLSSFAVALLAASSGAQAQYPYREAGADTVGPAGDDRPGSTWRVRVVEETSSAYAPLTRQQRWDLYLRRAFWSPGAVLRAAGPALGSHLKTQPPEWGQGTAGYSRRFINRFGRFALKETYEAAGAAALGHEVRYMRSSGSGLLPRAGHALAATFVTYDKNGRRTPHVARLGSAFAAEFTGNLWMPAGYRTGAQAVRGVGIELGMNGVFNLVREFSPELKRALPWR